MKNSLKSLPYLFILVWFWIPALQANNSYSWHLEDIFHEQYYSAEGYECNFCFFNAGELARKIKEKLGQNIDENDLYIIVIKNKDATNPMIAENLFRIQHSVVGLLPRNGQVSQNKGQPYARWKYHAALEYQGKILDLDIKKRKGLLPIRQYFDEMFPPLVADFTKHTYNHPEDNVPIYRHYNDNIEIIKVPITEYFKQFAKKPPKEERKSLAFIWQYPSTDLLKYLDSVAPVPEEQIKKPSFFQKLMRLWKLRN